MHVPLEVSLKPSRHTQYGFSGIRESLTHLAFSAHLCSAGHGSESMYVKIKKIRHDKVTKRHIEYRTTWKKYTLDFSLCFF